MKIFQKTPLNENQIVFNLNICINILENTFEILCENLENFFFEVKFSSASLFRVTYLFIIEGTFQENFITQSFVIKIFLNCSDQHSEVYFLQKRIF